MSEDKSENLVGWDAARYIREAQKQIAQAAVDGKRRAEVDGPIREQKLVVDTMIFKVGDGWKIETIKEATPALGTVTAYDREEKFLVAELRWQLARQLVENRVCREDDARYIAQNAAILIHGRVEKPV